MNFQEAIQTVFSKYAVFKGRAMRSEYWYFVLFVIIVNLILNLIHPTLSNVFSYATFIPGLAVLVRRLHDIGKSGWYSLVFYGPFFLLFGYLIYIISKVGIDDFQNLSEQDLQRIMDETNAEMYVGLIGILFLIGAIYIIVLLVTDSQQGDNEYGPNPKTGISQEDLDSFGNN